MLEERERINVRELFEMSRSKREMIITFLALLELTKEWKIYLVQDEPFGAIFASRRAGAPQAVEEGPAEEGDNSETDFSLSVA
jgi:chromatin segregation and condensation protein Rec8/ScpA/Scc1 (kleisin family)